VSVEERNFLENSCTYSSFARKTVALVVVQIVNQVYVLLTHLSCVFEREIKKFAIYPNSRNL
jgi:hypothetical protein